MPQTGTSPAKTWSRSDGNRSGPTTWQQSANAARGIQPTDQDFHDNDIYSMGNLALMRDGSSAATANLALGSFNFSNLGNGAARNSAPNIAQIQDGGVVWAGTSGGTANAQTLTLSPAITAYAAGQRFRFIAVATNTLSATININSVGLNTLQKVGNGVALTNLEADDIISGLAYEIEYNGTNWVLKNSNGVTILGRTENDTTERQFERITSGSGAGNVFSRRVVGDGSNNVATVNHYIGSTKVIGLTATSVLVPNATDFTEIATPAAPGAGLFRVYAKTGTGRLAYREGASGAETLLAVSQDPTVQRFTSGSSLTYTPTAGTVRIRVRMIAGGGGGGAANTSNGVAGGTASFGAWTAVGGGGGQGGVAGNTTSGGTGGNGGTNGTGTLIVRLGGSGGTLGSITGSTGVQGQGAGSPFGSGGAGQSTGGAAPGLNTSSLGAGGGGGGTSNAGGGGGGAGEYVEFYMNAAQFGASQTYTVGALGTGGPAGTAVGGNGGPGTIIIEEFYN